MLTIISGPMFAGKTTRLLKEIRAVPKDKTYIVYKPSIDTRYGVDVCVTHDGDHVPATNIDAKHPDFSQGIADGVSVIFLDELNFFTGETLYPEIQKVMAHGISVVGSGLLLDAMKRPFGATHDLLPYADAHIELFAVCDGCNGKAMHSYRKIKDKHQFLLGADEAYGACCEVCWEKLHA